MKIIGIDPGKTGAVAVLYPKNNFFVQRTPLKKHSEGKAKEYDLEEMFDMIRTMVDEQGVETAIIEQAWNYIGDGGRSKFMMGYGYGLWQMALTACELPFQVVHPLKWRNNIVTFRNKGKTSKEKKSMNARMFGKLFPDRDLKEFNDGEIDAILIAEYGRRVLAGEVK